MNCDYGLPEEITKTCHMCCVTSGYGESHDDLVVLLIYAYLIVGWYSATLLVLRFPFANLYPISEIRLWCIDFLLSYRVVSYYMFMQHVNYI